MGRSKRLQVLFLFIFFFFQLRVCFPFPADVEVVCNKDYFPSVLSLISQAKEEVCVLLFEMRYYKQYPDSVSNRLVQELISAVRRGVKVEVILDQSDWNRKNTEKNKISADVLLKGGVRVYLDDLKKTTHSKVIIVDGRYTVVGSTNWTYYGLERNNESSVVIDSPQIAKIFRDYFERIKARSEKFEGIEFERVRWIERIKRLFFRER
ncbi:MAG: hypothetical protein DRP75_02265 [Candidatus Omnitrophota bacterium]|nr:MAG: hypothetical protein DRP75_02265 [Candidatus Omnitrophota bacterium]